MILLIVLSHYRSFHLTHEEAEIHTKEVIYQRNPAAVFRLCSSASFSLNCLLLSVLSHQNLFSPLYQKSLMFVRQNFRPLKKGIDPLAEIYFLSKKLVLLRRVPRKNFSLVRLNMGSSYLMSSSAIYIDTNVSRLERKYPKSGCLCYLMTSLLFSFKRSSSHCIRVYSSGTLRNLNITLNHFQYWT